MSFGPAYKRVQTHYATFLAGWHYAEALVTVDTTSVGVVFCASIDAVIPAYLALLGIRIVQLLRMLPALSTCNLVAEH